MLIITVLNLNSEKEFRRYQKECIQAAEELLYGKEVIAALKEAKSEPELIRIMKNARHNM